MFRSISFVRFIMLVLTFSAVTACAANPPAVPALRVVATETFLADITQNVAGNRVHVDALLPIGVDPHSFEPTPADVKKVADSTLLIMSGAGLEEFLDELLRNAGGKRAILEASAGLSSRKPRAGEPRDLDQVGDPHFWLDPHNALQYVENIRVGLSQADPDGAGIYRTNADAYTAKLKELDQQIAEQVKTIPAERRLLVTNHASLGYYADRYGFQIIGTVIPSVTTGASPSAQQMAQLIDHIKATKTHAIFLEASANPQLANQIAKETGAKVVTGLYTHSITEANGLAPSYLEMMKLNTRLIVDALK